jgi:hypothetical protein
MSHIHHIGRLARILAGLAAALVAAIAAAPAALAAPNPAQPYPPPGQLSKYEPVAPPVHHTVVPAHTHAAVTGGMAGWQIALIALGAAILAAIAAVLVERARAARRQPTTSLA